MKRFVYVLLRALCAGVIGFLLVSNPQEMTSTIVRFIGGIFVFLGITQAAGFFLPRSDEGTGLRPIFPAVGLGCVLLGVILLLMPSTFVTFLMYMLSAFLLLAGALQFFSLVSERSVAPLRWWVFFTPLLLFAAGLFILVRPMTSASLPFLILGVGCLGYAVSEIFLALRLMYYEHRKRKELRQQYVDFEPVDEPEA